MSGAIDTSAKLTGTAGGVSNDRTRLASKENLDAAGQRFEAIFTGMMLKSMRATKLSDGLFDNKASEQFRDMQDTQLAQSMAVHAPIGIGKAMTEFLGRSQPVEAAAATPAATDGSTDAGTNGSVK
ncbi:rod-binding protein [Sphingomonas sp. AOB5]|uniref:rod-binding protein n=1 Tax=Sphingomonas sp. AOB5 TaxID=3034017 RepID=UPI0023F8E414|nr:rod-binding protein [Sphingomonas sp. AOB5]MDF7777521.1 rod-binding protein [Sphingomonas sp. AOB5]